MRGEGRGRNWGERTELGREDGRGEEDGREGRVSLSTIFQRGEEGLYIQRNAPAYRQNTLPSAHICRLFLPSITSLPSFPHKSSISGSPCAPNKNPSSAARA